MQNDTAFNMFVALETMLLLDGADLRGLGDAHGLGVAEGEAEELGGSLAVAGVAALETDERQLGAPDEKRAYVAEPFVDRKRVLVPDAKRLVELASGLIDVGDLAHRHRALAHCSHRLGPPQGKSTLLARSPASSSALRGKYGLSDTFA